ncbi:MerR family transcriptional regulator [Cetobacterium somerae]|uniref:MerR family transcriptional regulator n=1 Tax=Cetobacterium sp. NK01 TaxID=2993530 RepID=UPI002116B03E|nr:MerR family transcriptional regulator [Cetobacterium sp. NK01]MCQ8211156.1 MerR family transcriptional regulator [Cetobacterium sp. NK01]
MKEYISIRDIVKSMDLTTRTLRYYEEIGLIKSTQEGRGNRLYSKEEINKLIYLNELKNRGFSLKEIEGLLGNKCCNQKNIFLKSRVEENEKTINYLKWQNEKILEEMDIIEKLDMENVYIAIEEMPLRRYFSVKEMNKIYEDPDVESVWNLENYDIMDEKTYCGDFKKLLLKESDEYTLELYSHKSGDYILQDGKYVVAYSRDGLNKQIEVFQKMEKYLKEKELNYENEIYVENKFRIFCKRERKVVLITKAFIKIS